MREKVDIPTPATVLRAARELIARPGGWTQRALARDVDGQPTGVLAVEAVSFCPMGSLQRAAVIDHSQPYGACWLLHKAIGCLDITVWNDHCARTQAEVVAMFSKAIDLAETGAAPC